MSDRPEYRTLYTSFADDIDVHAMSTPAFKLFMMLKLTLPPAGIGVVYPSKLCDQVGVERAQLDAAFAELEAPKAGRERGWIVRDRTIVWIVNALACEPGLTPTNKNHVKYVRRLVASVDARSVVVTQFRDFYRAWFEGDTKPIHKGSGNPSTKGSPNPSESHADPKQRQRHNNDNTTQSGDLDKERPARATASAPPAAAPRFASLAELLAAAEHVDLFWRTYYHRRLATAERREDVSAQLLALANGEPVTLAGEPIRAFALERLDAKCAEILGEQLRDPDKAIVVLLKKLGDTSDGSAPGEVAAKSEEREAVRDEGTRRRELVDANAWLEDHAEIEATINAQLEADGFPESLAADDPRQIGRRIARESYVLRAYRDGQTPYAADAALTPQGATNA